MRSLPQNYFEPMYVCDILHFYVTYTQLFALFATENVAYELT